MELLSAIKNSTPGPEPLGEFRIQEAFWTRFGVRWPDDVEHWPEEKIGAYLTIMDIESKVMRDQQSESSGPSKSQGTEMAYRAMVEGKG